MKITLVSLTNDICSFGLRCISSFLKKEGHSVQMVFLSDVFLGCFRIRYDDCVLDEFINLCRDSDLVGISVMTNYFDKALQVTQRIKKELNIPLVWGGVHPTVKPEECLQYVDMVVLGEGEEILSELLTKIGEGYEGYSAIKGMGFKNNEGKIVKNERRALTQNLDLIPAPDYELENHFVLLDENRICKMDVRLLKKYLAKTHRPNLYLTMATRGCIYNCSYCINNFEWSNFPGVRRFRRRSTTHIINELSYITNKFNFINTILLDDDSFFSLTPEEMEEFCGEYKKNIGLPLFIYGINPLNFSEEKLRICLDAGLKKVRIGIQTGSERINKHLYRRNVSNQKIIEIVRTINKYKLKMEPPLYDFILDNPWEKDDDLVKTLSLLIEIPRPYTLVLYSLTFYPGTELYEKAKKEGIIKDDLKDVYQKHYRDLKHTYLNDLFPLFCHIPKLLQRLLISKILISTRLSHIVHPIIKIVNFGFRFSELIFKGFKAILTGEISSFFLFIKQKIYQQNKYY